MRRKDPPINISAFFGTISRFLDVRRTKEDDKILLPVLAFSHLVWWLRKPTELRVGKGMCICDFKMFLMCVELEDLMVQECNKTF